MLECSILLSAARGRGPVWPRVVIRPGNFVRYACVQAARGYMSGILPRSWSGMHASRLTDRGHVRRSQCVWHACEQYLGVSPPGAVCPVSPPGGGVQYRTRAVSPSGAPGGFSSMNASKITARGRVRRPRNDRYMMSTRGRFAALEGSGCGNYRARSLV